mgnify:CR=1 FL=1
MSFNFEKIGKPLCIIQEKKAGDMLFASKTAEEAAFNFGKYYERPKAVERIGKQHLQRKTIRSNKSFG